jgi:hypothetical protein
MFFSSGVVKEESASVLSGVLQRTSETGHEAKILKGGSAAADRRREKAI